MAKKVKLDIIDSFLDEPREEQVTKETTKPKIKLKGFYLDEDILKLINQCQSLLIAKENKRISESDVVNIAIRNLYEKLKHY
jgi:hypothetical protein